MDEESQKLTAWRREDSLFGEVGLDFSTDNGDHTYYSE